MIFYKQGVKSKDKKGNKVYYDFKNKINNAVFPGHQGGPHNHVIAAISTALLDAQSIEFKEYQQ